MEPLSRDDVRTVRGLFTQLRRGANPTQLELDALVDEWTPRVLPDKKDNSESFVIADGDGNPTGVVGPRWAFHLFGLRHQAVEIMMATESGLVVLQRRSPTKEDWPGMFDVTAAGHVPVKPDGTFQTYEEGAWKEIAEEIGLTENEATTTLREGKLTPLGNPYLSLDQDHKRNPPFFNAEVRQIFSATLTEKGISRIQFPDGEVTGIIMVTIDSAWEMLAYSKVASGLRYTLPRYLDHLERARNRA